jgi:hypothetical protein
MEYRGIKYHVVQVSNLPERWRWTVLAGRRILTNNVASRTIAMGEVRQAIDGLMTATSLSDSGETAAENTAKPNYPISATEDRGAGRNSPT